MFFQTCLKATRRGLWIWKDYKDNIDPNDTTNFWDYLKFISHYLLGKIYQILK